MAATIGYVTNELSLGGTEKGMAEHALRLDRARFGPRVVTVEALGPRAQGLRDAGVSVETAGGSPERLTELLEGVDLVHVYRPGAGDLTVPVAARDAGVSRVVETNVFGLHDPATAAQVDFTLLLSRYCALRYRRELGLGYPEMHRRHRVMPLPLAAQRLRESAPSREQARESLDLDPRRPVIARVGRADDFKWRNLLVDMLPALIERVPDVQVLLVGTTEAKRRRLQRRGVIGSCRLIDPVTDEAELAALYAAADVLVTAAELGESQGLAIAEAMSLARPLVTCSTPWVDNAQVELVREGNTGHLAAHPAAFAEAVAGLLEDPERARRYGERGRALVDGALDPAQLTRSLESLYDGLLESGVPPPDWTPGPVELEQFEAGYPALCRSGSRPLTRRESAEVRLARERERLRRYAGLVRPSRWPLAAGLARGRLSALRRGGGRDGLG